MKYPVKVKYRGQVLAKIYNKGKNYPMYRVCWRVNGQRRMKAWPTYSEAKKHADGLVPELYTGSQVTALSAGQAGDALAAFDIASRFYKQTGRRLTLREGMSILCETLAKINGYSLDQVVTGFFATAATVKRKLLAEAVKDFCDARAHLGEAKEGERSKRSPVYIYNTKMWLEEFANSLPGHAVCDLTKELLNVYIDKFKALSAKSRNDRRAIVKQFLGWCVAQDYLTPAHRLFEAVGFKAEDKDITKIGFYRPNELRLLLDNADEELLPVIALGGLAGLRREEILRLPWESVWRVKDHVEIDETIAKGRKRRLVSICPALAAWLRSYRKATGQVWGKSPDALEEAFTKLRESLSIPSQRNGLRHAFITYHMATHTNENLTAAEAGNSPQMIHESYRALATKRDAKKWFAVRPAKAAKNILTLDTKTA